MRFDGDGKHGRLDGTRFVCTILNIALVSLIVLPRLITAAAQENGSPLPNVQRALDALDSPESDVRLAAAKLLGDVAQTARKRFSIDAPGVLKSVRDAGPKLARLAQGGQLAGRRVALIALGQTQSAGSVAAPVWTQSLKDADPDIRRAAAEGMRAHANRMLQELRASDTLEAEQWTLTAQFAEDTIALAPVFQAALDSAPAVRAEALEALSQLLSAMERIRDVTLRETTGNEAAFKALKQSLPPLAEALKSLVPSLAAELLREAYPRNQVAAAVVLEKMAEQAREDPDPTLQGTLVRRELAPEGQEAARILSASLQEAVPNLASALADRNDDVKLAAMNALEPLSPQIAPAVPALVKVTRSSNRFVRWSAARTLGRAGPANQAAGVQELAALLDDDDMDVRAVSAQSLEKYGNAAGPAVSALSRAAERNQPDLQVFAIQALGAIGPEAKGAIPGLVAALDPKRVSDARVRRLVPPLLGKLGPAARPALPALRAALNDPDSEVRQSAADALLKILTPK